MLFPIRWPEPFGLVMVEAMACGTPVVTTNWGAAPELVADGVTGFRRDSADDLAHAIGRSSRTRSRRPAGPGSRSGSRPRPWSGATGRSTPTITRPPITEARPVPRDFTLRRSVITMAGVTVRHAHPRIPAPLQIEDLHVASTAARSCAACPSRSAPASSTPSWARTAPGSRRWPTRCSATRSTRSPPAGSSWRARTSPPCPPTSGPPGACSSASSTPKRSPASRSSTSCARRWRAARASRTSRSSRCACRSWTGASGSAWTTASRSGTSTRASPAARRSATRCSRWRCSRPTSPCSTRPTPGSTSTRSAGRGRHRGGPPRPAAPRHPARSRTTSASSTTSPPTSCTCSSTAASSRTAVPSSRDTVEAEGSTPSASRCA